MSKRYRFGGGILVTLVIAYLASKTGASGWEMAAILGGSMLGLQMVAGLNVMQKAD